MSRKLLIVFTKNLELGKVKTRLAASIGDEAALKVYQQLVDITERETLQVNNVDLHIYYTDRIDENHWLGKAKFTQVEGDLGAKMRQAYEHAFALGFDQVIGIGSDLPEISSTIINQAFQQLANNDTVFGPAKDGGYYLLGMNTFQASIFENKPWSTESLLKVTVEELEDKGCSTALLGELNDVDTLEDLKAYSINSYGTLDSF